MENLKCRKSNVVKPVSSQNNRLHGEYVKQQSTPCDSPIRMNDGKEFENNFTENYPETLELMKENASDNVRSLYLHILNKEEQFSTKL